MEVILESLSTPEDIKPIAAAYLQVSFLGLTAQLFYNVCNSMLQAFTQDKLVLQNGLQAVYYVFPCYWGYAICQVYIGGLRGLGNTFYPMLTSLIAYSLFRVGWCQAWDRFLHDMIIVYTAYDVSFFIMAALLYWGYRHYLKGTLMSPGHGVSHHVPG